MTALKSMTVQISKGVCRQVDSGRYYKKTLLNIVKYTMDCIDKISLPCRKLNLTKNSSKHGCGITNLTHGVKNPNGSPDIFETWKLGKSLIENAHLRVFMRISR